MTAIAAPRRTTQLDRPHLTFPRLLHSEAIKLLTLRSTWWALGITVVLSVGASLLIAFAAGGAEGFAPANVVLMPTQFTMLVAGILGAMVITGEYSTGMIRSTMSAEPRRGAVVLAKAVVVSFVMMLTTIATYALTIAVTTPLLTARWDWSDPQQSIVPLAFGVLSMAVFTLIGLGFGFVIRAAAGAIAATVGVLFVLPIVLSLFVIAGPDWQWIVNAGEYLPSSAASALTTPGAEIGNNLLVLGAWAIVPLVAGWITVRSRDV